MAESAFENIPLLVGAFIGIFVACCIVRNREPAALVQGFPRAASRWLVRGCCSFSHAELTGLEQRAKTDVIGVRPELKEYAKPIRMLAFPVVRSISSHLRRARLTEVVAGRRDAGVGAGAGVPDAVGPGRGKRGESGARCGGAGGRGASAAPGRAARRPRRRKLPQQGEFPQHNSISTARQPGRSTVSTRPIFRTSP